MSTFDITELLRDGQTDRQTVRRMEKWAPMRKVGRSGRCFVQGLMVV